MKKYSIAIVGPTGLVGTTLIKLLRERNFPYEELFLLGRRNSDVLFIPELNEKFPIHALEDFDFTKTKVAFFCVSTDLSRKYVPIATSANNIVIDKSFCFRNHEKVPLIVPEVNISDIKKCHALNIIANPNCNTIPIAVALAPIHATAGIERINIATYQSVSGAGKAALQQLSAQSEEILTGSEKNYNEIPYAFNVIPHIDQFENNDYTLEEMKMVWELKKIFNDESIAINPTAVRVPVMCGHAAALHIETKTKVHPQEIIELLQNVPSINVASGNKPYITPRELADTDNVYVGRIRKDISCDRGINMWVVADNLRKGAALNAIQIAEHLIKEPGLIC